MFKQVDIVVVKFPFTDGSEFKRRPAMIISNAKVNKTKDYLLVQITSKYHEDGLTFPIDDNDCLISLPLKSFIRAHKVFTVNKNLILSKITQVSPHFFNQISDEIVSLISKEKENSNQ